MTQIVNLRQVRKQRDRDKRRTEGDSNAARFGEARILRQAREAEADRAARAHEAHKTDDG
ncbi:DUF4169 family protein [Paracoccus sp. (in: a-proteobacteria)]|uniref:DUF4169 family protein n=1 Tax=Paracoccus sp. TaxID=267 RepID=UPI003A8A660A